MSLGWPGGYRVNSPWDGQVASELTVPGMAFGQAATGLTVPGTTLCGLLVSIRGALLSQCPAIDFSCVARGGEG